MIEISYGRDASGFIRKLSVSGHSGYAEAGGDIVCAAVSALTQTAAIALENGVTQADEEAAFLAIELPNHLPLNEMHDAQVIMRAILGGLAAIAEEYPRYVSIREV